MTTLANNQTIQHLPLDIGVGGMTCASCVGRVERALNKQATVSQASVNLATEMVRVVPSDAVSDTAAWQRDMRRVIRDAGYEPQEAQG